MGLIDKILRKPKAANKIDATGFKTFTEYQPVFTSFSGGVYEQELTRAAIERFALACSKLKPEIKGNANPKITHMINTVPNKFMTWSSFIARVATILECDTTAYIVKVFDRDMQTVVGLYPVKPEIVELLEFNGEVWVRFTFSTGDTAAIELKHVCILTKFQYQSDFFGEKNCIESTMNLIHKQNQAQESAIEMGATIRFIGSITGQVREEDMKKKRERFAQDNLSSLNKSGIMLYDSTFNNVTQVDTQSYTMDSKEMELIQESVFNYFAINKDILQNDFSEDKWGAWYEGKIEPFAVRLGEGLSQILYTERQRLAGNEISFSSNRLQYASNASKRNMIADMLDRGVFTINQALEILQLPPVEDGDVRVIRGEYINAASLTSQPKYDHEGEPQDLTKNPSDQYGQIDPNDKETGE